MCEPRYGLVVKFDGSSLAVCGDSSDQWTRRFEAHRFYQGRVHWWSYETFHRKLWSTNNAVGDHVIFVPQANGIIAFRVFRVFGARAANTRLEPRLGPWFWKRPARDLVPRAGTLRSVCYIAAGAWGPVWLVTALSFALLARAEGRCTTLRP
jgi:hypothetical protein